MYTEHSLWHKTATPVRILNRATIGFDKALVAVSPAAHDALPTSLQAHATVVIHGVDVTQSDALVSRGHEIRAEVRSEFGCIRRRDFGSCRGQPPGGERLRRSPRNGSDSRR